MGFLSSPIEAANVAAINRSFLAGAAQQADENATALKNERADMAAAAAAKQAEIDAVSAKSAATSAALYKAKHEAGKLNFEAGKQFLSSQIEKDRPIAEDATGLHSDADKQQAVERMKKNMANFAGFNQSYASFGDSLATGDPLKVPDFTFDPSKSFIPPPPAEIGPKGATELAKGAASLTHENLENQKLLHPEAKDTGGKLTPAEQRSRDAEAQFDIDFGNGSTTSAGVIGALDKMNVARMNAGAAGADPNRFIYGTGTKDDPGEGAAPIMGVMNAYKGTFSKIRDGYYDDMNPAFSTIGKSMQAALGAKWNHPGFVSDQANFLTGIISNANATADEKKAAVRLRDKIVTSAPQFEALKPYYNAIEAPPK